MNFQDVKHPIRRPTYAIDCSLDGLLRTLERWKPEMNPVFQRDVVWDENQSVAFVEFFLKFGHLNLNVNNIYFNQPRWGDEFVNNKMVIVDGKQRLTALTRFLENDLKAYGKHFREFEGRLSDETTLKLHVMDFTDMKLVYTWYLAMNTAGTPHTQDELDKVYKLMVEDIEC